MILSELARLVSAQQGVFYIMNGKEGEPELKFACQLRLSGSERR